MPAPALGGLSHLDGIFFPHSQSVAEGQISQHQLGKGGAVGGDDPATGGLRISKLHISAHETHHVLNPRPHHALGPDV